MNPDFRQLSWISGKWNLIFTNGTGCPPNRTGCPPNGTGCPPNGTGCPPNGTGYPANEKSSLALLFTFYIRCSPRLTIAITLKCWIIWNLCLLAARGKILPNTVTLSSISATPENKDIQREIHVGQKEIFQRNIERYIKRYRGLEIYIHRNKQKDIERYRLETYKYRHRNRDIQYTQRHRYSDRYIATEIQIKTIKTEIQTIESDREQDYRDRDMKSWYLVEEGAGGLEALEDGRDNKDHAPVLHNLDVRLG